MIVLTDNLTELNVLQTAIDYLRHSMLKDESWSQEEEKTMYINQCNAPELITMDDEEYNALMGIKLEWHLPAALHYN